MSFEASRFLSQSENNWEARPVARQWTRKVTRTQALAHRTWLVNTRVSSPALSDTKSGRGPHGCPQGSSRRLPLPFASGHLLSDPIFSTRTK